ncbi:ABC transporter ATP-binding protein [Candidatus Babeliales bacterium]|nr:ABC transporter ATP-binding protein [Candidatus Babeliales bacterium]
MKLIKIDNLSKIYKMGETEVIALNKISLEIGKGEFIAITGTSGSGKSTLMHLLGLLDVPTSGDILLEEKSIVKFTQNELAKVRNQKIGFVFQKFHLLPSLTATDNVALPKLYAGEPEALARKQAKKNLEAIGLGDRLEHYPYQLSGGQQQRVAIARSLINNPQIILADEPTGNLDSKTGETILKLFKKLNKEKNVTIIIVTHEPEVANKTNRIIELVDGKIISDKAIS